MVEKHGWAPYIKSEESIVKQVYVGVIPVGEQENVSIQQNSLKTGGIAYEEKYKENIGFCINS